MDRIKELEKEFQNKKAQILKEQNNCKHDWDKVKYDPEIKKEPYGYKTVGQGSDIWTEPEGYHDVSYNRWSRTCKICSKIEYTKEQEVVQTKPKF